MVTVMNLSTGDKLVYSCNPRMAVICAYAQSNHNFNTWDYEKNYGKLVQESKLTFLCGDFSSYKNGRMF